MVMVVRCPQKVVAESHQIMLARYREASDAATLLRN